MAEPLLEARALSVDRGGRRTLEDISLSLYPGEILALIGPNGAGKSTLLKALLGLIPSDGEVRCGDRSLREMHEKERAREIAYIPQEGLLNQGFRAFEVVAQGRYAHLGRRRSLTRADHEAVRAALKTAQAESLAGRRYDRLSLGERRRVLIARALASGARILALDEPDASLDLAQKLALFELLRALRDRGYGILVVLHGLDEMRALADRALLLSAGQKVVEGPPDSVLREEIIREVYGVALRGDPPRFERLGEPIEISESPALQRRSRELRRALPLLSINLALLALAFILGAAGLILKSGLARDDARGEDASERAETLRDHRGFSFRAGGYERILSGSVTADQILAELISPSRVVGITSYGKNFAPASLRFPEHPTVDRLADLERIVALSPDLVIVHDLADEAALARLRELGIPVFDLGPVGGAEDFARDIRTLGALIGEAERGEALSALHLGRLERISTDLPREGRPRALYIRSFGRDLLGGAVGTHYHDVIVYAGLEDAASGLRGWPRYEAEQILTLDPELLVTAKGKGALICASPGLDALEACREGAILEIDAEALDDSAFGLERSALELRRAYDRYRRER